MCQLRIRLIACFLSWVEHCAWLLSHVIPLSRIFDWWMVFYIGDVRNENFIIFSILTVTYIYCLCIPDFMGEKGAPHWRENWPSKWQSFRLQFCLHYMFVTAFSILFAILHDLKFSNFVFYSVGIWLRNRVLVTYGSEGRYSGTLSISKTFKQWATSCHWNCLLRQTGCHIPHRAYIGIVYGILKHQVTSSIYFGALWLGH